MKKKKLFQLDSPVTLDPTGEDIWVAMKQQGYLPGNMLTLAGPLPGHGPDINVTSEWYRDTFHDCGKAFFDVYNHFPQYELVMTRGWDGNGKWSCHVVWKNEYPSDLKWLVDWWNNRFGTSRCVLSPHDHGLRYWVKNMLEPDARTHGGVYNRRNSPKKGKGYRG